MNRTMLIGLVCALCRKGRDIIYWCCIRLKDGLGYCFLKGTRISYQIYWWCFVQIRQIFFGEIVVPIINQNVIERYFNDKDGIDLHQLIDACKEFISKENNETIFHNATMVIFHRNQSYIFRSGSGKFNIVANNEHGTPNVVTNY